MNKNKDHCRTLCEHSNEALDSFKGQKLGGLPSDYPVLRNYSDYSLGITKYKDGKVVYVLCMYVCLCVCVCMYVCLCVYVCMYVCMYVCVCVCVCVCV